MMQPDELKIGYLEVAKRNAPTNHTATWHRSQVVLHKVAYSAQYYFLYMCIIDINTNIVSKMIKFANYTKLNHRSWNMNDITKISIILLVWQTSGKYISMLTNVLWWELHATKCKATINVQSTVVYKRTTAISRNDHHQRLQVEKKQIKAA